MKKSEMIEIIKGCLLYASKERLAEDILYVLERHGMAPPFTEIIENNNGDIIAKQARQWEEE